MTTNQKLSPEELAEIEAIRDEFNTTVYTYSELESWCGKLLASHKAVEGENNLYENHCAECEAMILASDIEVLELRQQNETLREALESIERNTRGQGDG